MNPKTNRAITARTTPLRLTQLEILNPQLVVQSFFKSFDLEYVRELLWLMTSITICLDDEKLGTSISRGQILAFYEELDRALEAMCLILPHETLNTDI
jgi:hypothetical protein